MTVSLGCIHDDVRSEPGCALEPGEPGSGSPLFYINTWAMVWPNDYPALAT